MYTLETGMMSAPSIVFLHGGGTANWMWKKQVMDLQDYHLLVPDLPGHGKTNQEKWISVADTADQVAEMIRQKASGGRAHVVGLSLGGYIVVMLLSRHPEVVQSGLVSGINALPYKNEWLLKGFTILMMPLMKFKPMLKLNARAMKLSEEDQALVIQGALDVDTRSMLKITSEALDFRVPPISADLNVPALFVVGEKEVKNAIKSNPVLVQSVPGAVGRMVKGVGHAWVGEKPELFSSMVRSWIEGQELPEELVVV